jgi:mRNA-degrading endonuclease toxin of MazEF toxin-antitoxin module
MVDKITSVPMERIGKRAGKLPVAVLHMVDEAIELWLGIRR